MFLIKSVLVKMFSFNNKNEFQIVGVITARFQIVIRYQYTSQNLFRNNCFISEMKETNFVLFYKSADKLKAEYLEVILHEVNIKQKSKSRSYRNVLNVE